MTAPLLKSIRRVAPMRYEVELAGQGAEPVVLQYEAVLARGIVLIQEPLEFSRLFGHDPDDAVPISRAVMAFHEACQSFRPTAGGG